MSPRMALLALPATAVVAGLVWHSLRTRGPRDTWWFFGLALLFGIVRGNVIWWITTQHFDDDFPYIFGHRLIGVFHDSLIADLGWILCLYLGAAVATAILQRIPPLRDRVFALIALACLFNSCVSYAVEATAIEMDWWDWTLSTKSEFLRNVPVAGIEAWYSVAFDFLTPYLLIGHVRKPGQWWPFLSLLIFPVHMLTHLSNTRLSDALPFTPYNLWYWGMVLATLVLPFASRATLRRPWLPAGAAALNARGDAVTDGGGPGFDRRVRWIPAAGLATVLAVLLVSDLLVVRNPAMLVTKAALVYMALIAFTPIPPVIVLGVALALLALGGKLFLAPLLVPVFYYALRGQALWRRRPALKWMYVAVPLLLTWLHYDWAVAKNEVDRRYRQLITEGRQAAAAGQSDAAIDLLQEAAQLKPYSVPAYEGLAGVYANLKRYDAAERVIRTLIELRPISGAFHANLGTIYLLRGDPVQAEQWFRRALELDPDEPYIRQMLAEIERRRRSPDAGAAPH